MKAAKYILNFCIIFFLVSVVWLKVTGITVESNETAAAANKFHSRVIDFIIVIL